MSARAAGAPGVRWGEIDPRDRRLLVVVGALVLLCAPVGLVNVVGLGWVPTSEDAQIALRARDVFSAAHTPTLGMPTSPLSAEGTLARHPGPLLFWLFAPGVRLLGLTWGLALTATLANTAAALAIGWVVLRNGSARLAAASLLAAGAVLFSVGGSYATFRPLNLHIALLPLLLLLFVTWAILQGDGRLLPLAALCASFVLQCDLTYGITVLPVSVVAFVGWWTAAPTGGRRAVRWRPRLPRAPGPTSVGLVAHLVVVVLLLVAGALAVAVEVLGAAVLATALAVAVAVVLVAAATAGMAGRVRRATSRDRRTLALALLVVVACWAVPAGEAVANDGGNLTTILGSTTEEPNPTEGLDNGLSGIAGVVGPVPEVVRSPGTVPLGRTVGPLTLGLLALAGWTWWRARRAGDRQVGRGLALGGLLLVTTVVTASRLPSGITGAGHVMWVRPVGAFWWFAVSLGVFRYVVRPLAARAGIALRPVVAGAMVVLALVVGLPAAFPSVLVPDRAAAWDYDTWVYDAARPLSTQVVDSLEPGEDGPYLLDGRSSSAMASLSHVLAPRLAQADVETLSVEVTRHGPERSFFDHRDEAVGALVASPTSVPEPLPGRVVATWEPTADEVARSNAVVADVLAEVGDRPLVVDLGRSSRLVSTLDGYVPVDCPVWESAVTGCDAPPAGEQEAELVELVEGRDQRLPPEVLVRLYADGAVASPTISPELLGRIRAHFVEPVSVSLVLPDDLG